MVGNKSAYVNFIQRYVRVRTYSRVRTLNEVNVDYNNFYFSPFQNYAFGVIFHFLPLYATLTGSDPVKAFFQNLSLTLLLWLVC